MDSDSEPTSKLILLIGQLVSQSLYVNLDWGSVPYWDWDWDSKLISVTIQIISLVNSIDLDLQPKPESELMSLVSQAIFVFNSMELDSQPKPFSELISLIKRTISLFKSLDLFLEPEPLSKLKSLITQEHSLLNSYSDWEIGLIDVETLSLRPKPDSDLHFFSLVQETMSLEPELELMSLVHQIFSLVIPMTSKWKTLLSLCPQVRVIFEEGKFHVTGKVKPDSNKKLDCLPTKWDKFSLTGEYYTHFLCRGCGGKNHERSKTAPVEIKHPLHPKHFLQLVLLEGENKTRKCYCCDENLLQVFYYCSACDFAMNIACSEKSPIVYIEHPKWHEHPLAMFSRTTSLTCDVCALVHSSCPHYICPPCGFVVHQSCISLPRVIRISRHLHRIRFIPSFDQGDWSCGVCRKKMDNDYGGYSCIREGCSYAAHSKCATQKNVWDGKDLDGEPEEILEPFVRISNGIIQHFSHQHHHQKSVFICAMSIVVSRLGRTCT